MTEEQTVEGGLAEPEELEPEQGSLDLAAPEDHHDRAAWEAAAAGVLRKARRLNGDDADELVWDRLTRTTYDGVEITPLGVRADLEGLRTWGRATRAGAWDNRVFLNVRGEYGTERKRASEEAVVDLEGGATSLWLELGALMRADELDEALDGVMLDLAPVVLSCRGFGVDAAFEFEKLLEKRGVAPAPGTNLGADPLSGPLYGGGMEDQPEGWPWESTSAAKVALRLGTLGLVADGSAAHDAGGSEAQELGWSIAAGVHYLRRMVDDGRIDLDDAVGVLEFRYAATDEQFLTIAKLRAARRLWARVLELSGATPVEQRQHVVTSRPMMSKYDPWVNMLRTTVAAFAAGVGGADAVTVLPFDSMLGRSDAFARRIARNTAALLVEESHVATVTDPAGGAYAVERLTDDLATAGWEEFQRIEASGGAWYALEDGSFQGRLGTTAERRTKDVARRRRAITGLSEFPHLTETLPERPAQTSDYDVVQRYGFEFEAMRDAPPTGHVFLATMGAVAAHTARATFAANLLAAGGIAVDLAGATETAEDLVAAYGGQRVVCLAGSDGAYDAWAHDAVSALREAGARWVVVAGRQRDDVDDACAVGGDAVAFLTRTREKLA